MAVLTRENATTGASGLPAVLAWYGIEEKTDFRTPIALAVTNGIGVVGPSILLYALPARTDSR